MSESLLQIQALNRYYRKLEPLFAKKETRAYTMLLLSILSIVFFGLFAIKPTLSTISLLKRQILDGEALNEELEKKINSLVSAQNSYESVQNDLPLVYSLLPQKSEFSLLLRKVEVVAAEQGLQITGIQFEPVIIYEEMQTPKTSETVLQESVPTPSETLSTTPIKFRVTLNGPYENLVLFLEKITSQNRLITLQSLGFTPGENRLENATIELGILTNAYYFPSVE